MLRLEGFEVEEETAANVPFGALCRTRSPTLAAFEEFSVESYVSILTLALGSCLAEKTLEGPEGAMDENDLQELKNSFRKGLKDTGAEWHLKECLAKRIN